MSATATEISTICFSQWIPYLAAVSLIRKLRVLRGLVPSYMPFLKALMFPGFVHVACRACNWMEDVMIESVTQGSSSAAFPS